jgi:hypothetical protein
MKNNLKNNRNHTLKYVLVLTKSKYVFFIIIILL